MALRGDYAAGYRAVRRILALGEARGYEPDTSQARSCLHSCCLLVRAARKQLSRQAQRAREGLIAGGDLANAAYSYHATVYYLLDCAPTLDGCVAEVEAGLAFVRRTGNEQARPVARQLPWLAAVLRGESAAAAMRRSRRQLRRQPAGASSTRISPGAIAAAIFGDQDGLARHTAAAMPLLPATAGLYPPPWPACCAGWRSPGRPAPATVTSAATLLAELDEVIALAGRPGRRRAGQLPASAAAARGRAGLGGRRLPRRCPRLRRRPPRGRRGASAPWHRALITERRPASTSPTASTTPATACSPRPAHEYAAWGATAKVAQLDWAYPALRPRADTTAAAGDQPAESPAASATVTTGTIDLLGILSASQALSSETSIERLHARVVDVLGAMTGATDVHLLLWNDDRQDWLLPHQRGGAVPGRRHRPRTRDTDVGAALHAADTANRWSWTTPPATTGSPATPTSPTSTAAPCWPCPSSAAACCGRCCCWKTGSSAARSPPSGSTRSSSSPANSPSPWTTPSSTPSYRRIADEQAALRRVATLVARAAPPGEVFAAVAEEVARLLEVDHVAS